MCHSDGMYKISIPDDVAIGEYAVNVVFSDGSTELNDHASIIVVMNPFSEKSPVYMEDEKQRTAYLLNTSSTYFAGTASSHAPYVWSLDQFNRQNVKAALKLLGFLSSRKRKDHVAIVRHISEMGANGQVMVGRWDGTYEPHKNPTSWTSSTEVLQEYVLKHRAAKYTQCWVFAGVGATLLRSLGIPTRVITNFESGKRSLARGVVAVPVTLFTRDLMCDM